MTRRHAILAAVMLLAPAPAFAQSGVFDMGQLTGTLAVDGVTQAEEERAGIERRSTDESSARARANCARLPEFRRRHGANDPRVRQFAALCTRAGY